MKSIFTLVMVLIFNFTNSQSNGYIVEKNDTIKVTFNVEDITVRSYGKIEKLQEKVKYFLNGKSITSTPSELKSFCIKSNSKDFCFDSFYDESAKKGNFLFRLSGKKVDKLTVYQFYGSGFIGVNYTVRLGYLVKKVNEKDYVCSVKFPKDYKALLEKIVDDCPPYLKHVQEEIKKLLFEDEFENYLNEYKRQCTQ